MKRINTYVFTFALALFSYLQVQAQTNPRILTGSVVDGANNLPIPIATIVVKSAKTGNILKGTTSDLNGYFSIHCDSSAIRLEISFVGYETIKIDQVSSQEGLIEFGTIILKESPQLLDEISIVAEQSTVEFKLDKRVFNVGQDISSSGMGALDVLNRVPSVNVDIEGEITLRGNAGVQILINGKPSVIADQQSNALSSITADMIESVEVITNPSAKYEAEGTSGIINIILKKEDKKGMNGSATINTGVPNNHSLGVSVNYRTEKFNFFSQFGAGYRSRPNDSESQNIDLLQNTRVFSTGSGGRDEQFYNITLGTDYYLNDYNIITLSGNYAYEIEKNPYTTAFDLYDGSGELYAQYDRTETTDATNPKWQYDLQYKKQFRNNEDHVLLISGLGKFFGKDNVSEFVNAYTYGPETNPNQQTTTDYYQADYIYKLDYTNPVSEKITFEAGAQYEINDVGNDYAVFNQEGNAWLPDSSLTNDFVYNQKVLGLYGTVAYEGNKWGIKAGLRVENTDLQTLLKNTNEENQQYFTNFFPSLHTSYKFSNRLSVQAGYTKRILRPRLWDLNPFFNIQNNYNVRTGNPNLHPEYADSYELTGIYIMEDASVNASVYYLHTTSVVERVTFFEDNISITTPQNIGTRDKVGIDLSGKYTISKWFTLTGDFNYGVFAREGMYANQNFDFNGDQWTFDLTTTFKLPFNIDVELSPNVQSGYATIQGEVSGYASLDAGIRKKLWDGKGIFNLGVRDVFASRIQESIVDQETYYVYSFSQRGRLFTMGFSFSFGKGEAMTYSGGGWH